MQRQIRALKTICHVTAMGLTDPGIEDVRFIDAGGRPLTILQKAYKGARLKAGCFEAVYHSEESVRKAAEALADHDFGLIVANDLVFGDTNSTLAGALAAAKLNIPVAHVEAGLRSFNRRMPEGINRVVTDHMSTLLYCPTGAAVGNLAQEGITAGVAKVGDVMYDATLHAAARARSSSRILERLRLTDGAFALATVHRAENTDDPAVLSQILSYLRIRAGSKPMVLPLHPRTRSAVEGAALSLDGLTVVPPCGYRDMHRLLQGATTIYTDSGGLQKEAYFHRTPCVTLRGETEWVETVACGWNRLWCGPDYRPRRTIDDYGDGTAARRIAAHLTDWLDRPARKRR